MNTYTEKFKIRLGLFVAVGIALFIATIFIIGRQKNLFSPVFKLSSTFYNVSGLLTGNNIRFSGINVGTVDNIFILNDSTVQVDVLIKKEVQPFIKTDSKITIGSEGIVGDKLLLITQGSSTAAAVKDGAMLASAEPVETDAILASLQVSADNAQVITEELAEIMVKINTGKGTLGKLISDPSMANNLSSTLSNLKTSSKGLTENMEAAKHNFLLKGYFKRKERAAAKLKKEAEQKAAEKKVKN